MNYEWMFGGPAHIPLRVVDSSGKYPGRQSASARRPPVAERVVTLLAVIVLGASLEALVIWWLIRTLRFNRDVYPGLLHHWQLGFLCRRCGWVFYPSEGEDIVAVPPRFDLGYR